MKSVKFAAIALGLGLVACCSKENHKMGSYGYDVEFFRKNNIESIELTSPDGQQRILVVPGYQGRVMTSTAQGEKGSTLGWINYEYIESGELSPQFNPYGGEERFWFGPEGGPFSLYFKPGAEQVYENWLVPPVIDTEGWEIASKSSRSVSFNHPAKLVNASGTEFSIHVERTVTLLDKEGLLSVFGVSLEPGMQAVAYTTDNKVTNTGPEAWSKEKGLVSVWMLCMMPPTPTTTVFIPYKSDAEGTIVNDEYFGKVPADRLIVEKGIIYFKIDGLFRSKIGIPSQRALPVCGSYDSQKGLLTLLQTTLPETPGEYVNGQWGFQEHPYEGDVINSYNDGPKGGSDAPGLFYEIETSSPALSLLPGASAIHSQSLVHILGTESQIAAVVQSLFGIELSEISGKFVK